MIDGSMVDASNPGISLGSDGRLAGSFSSGRGIDPSRITYDFTTNFPEVPTPSASGYTLSAITDATMPPTHVITLPRSGDTAAADGAFYYTTTSVTLSGGILQVGPDTLDATHFPVKVVLVVTNTSGTTVEISSGAAIKVGPQSSLSIYAAGDVTIDGTGVVNGTFTTPNNPDNFHLYGTRTSADAASSGMQAITVAGTPLSGVLYAPNGNFIVSCATDTYGAVVGNQVTLIGDGKFHGDESLKRNSSLGIWGPTKWRELSTPADRSAFADQLAF
jgi:hypothetical protein